LVFPLLEARKHSVKSIRIIFIGFIICLLLVYVAYLFPLYLLSEGKLNLFRWESLFIIVVLIGGAGSIQNLANTVREVAQNVKHKQGFIPILDSFTGVLFIILALSLYAKFVYPKMSSIYGGGRRQKVLLVAKAEQLTFLGNVGMQPSSDDHKIGPFEVIYEASDYFIISVPESMKGQEHIKSIKLKKDMFDLTLYVDPEYKPTPTPSPTPLPTAFNHLSYRNN
jgi:hypothetical protein